MRSDGDDNEAVALRQGLVDQLISAGLLHVPRVEEAFRSVPRHRFLPDLPLQEVYQDRAIVTRRRNGIPISSSSQPAIMAIMLEQLDPRPGQRVLEIGAGTGYNAALIAQIVGDDGQVTTVDIDEGIVADARAHLTAAGFDRVRVLCADGGLGAPDSAPYDRIILTVGAWDIAPAWREQLKPDGRLVLPLSLGGVQKSIALTPLADTLASVSVYDCGFMRLRGAFAGPERQIALGPDPGLYLLSERPVNLDPAAVYAALTGPFETWPSGVQVSFEAIFGSLSLWLALHEPGFCGLGADGEVAERELLPRLFGFSRTSKSTAGLAEGASLALLAVSAGASVEQAGLQHPFELHVRGYGPEPALALRLLAAIRAWDTAGRPSSERLHLRAYPAGSGRTPEPGEFLLAKRWTELILSWDTPG